MLLVSFVMKLNDPWNLIFSLKNKIEINYYVNMESNKQSKKPKLRFKVFKKCILLMSSFK